MEWPYFILLYCDISDEAYHDTANDDACEEYGTPHYTFVLGDGVEISSAMSLDSEESL